MPFEIPSDQIREMQQVGLNMAKVFDAFCTEHHLTYFLCGGCCIGSIRNKGFIPWDDDVDVFMPRADYERLKREWVDTERYEIQIPTRAFNTQTPFLTICDKQTTFIKSYRRELDISHGVALDILPLDACPKGWARKVQKLDALLYSLYIVGKAPENHGRLVTAAGKLLLALAPSKGARYRLWRHFEKRMTRFRLEECEAITELCSGPHYMQMEYPKEAFEKAIRVPFEDCTLPIPVGYDAYLKMAFGNYMELPPVEKRVCHHEYEFMDMHTPYRKYKGVHYCTK